MRGLLARAALAAPVFAAVALGAPSARADGPLSRPAAAPPPHASGAPAHPAAAPPARPSGAPARPAAAPLARSSGAPALATAAPAAPQPRAGGAPARSVIAPLAGPGGARARVVGAPLRLSSTAQPLTRGADPWFGDDKARHFCASMVLASGGYALGALATEDIGGRIAIGAAVALGAGLAKEAFDAAGYGTPSFRDLVWDALGTSAGLGLSVWFNLATPIQF
ncbi:hypothetical protein [Sorangium sp. So ce1389]|uniref:hypothetical protein n=1 Tax=Sorangium sp. So ce1389 TaxID=3133336 RepID=UPI003F5FDD52